MLQNLPTKIQNNEKVIPLIFPQQINILIILSNYDKNFVIIDRFVTIK